MPARGLNPLTVAALANQSATVRLLVKLGARVDDADGYGNRALEHAARGRHGDSSYACPGAMLTLLTLGSNPAYVNKEGEQALTTAVDGGSAKAVRLLLERKNSMTHQCNDGCTPAKTLYEILSRKRNSCALHECKKGKCYTACLAALVKYGLPLRSVRGLFICAKGKDQVENQIPLSLQKATSHYPSIDPYHVGGFDIVRPEEFALLKRLNRKLPTMSIAKEPLLTEQQVADLFNTFVKNGSITAEQKEDLQNRFFSNYEDRFRTKTNLQIFMNMRLKEYASGAVHE